MSAFLKMSKPLMSDWHVIILTNMIAKNQHDLTVTNAGAFLEDVEELFWKALTLRHPFTKYGPGYDKKQVGGWSQSFGTLTDGKNVTCLTFATVRWVAHEVPFTSPSQALALFRSFLSGSPLPRPRD
ncbi:hypothetical protein NL676_006075 [Syzygium grande]|nr:hypothetical protein NL676_006075 [Syzygium grande]